MLAVEIIDVAIEVSADVILPYLLDRATALVERLGDSKQSVREAMVQLLAALANTPHCSPQVKQYYPSSYYLYTSTDLRSYFLLDLDFRGTF